MAGTAVRAPAPTVLSLRAECAGGPALDAVRASKDLHGLPRLTILIHGFNDSACDATVGYETFLAQDGIGDTAVFAAFGEVCLFLWPGDSRVLLGASYPTEIPRAIDAAHKLSAFLRSLARVAPLEVQLICHSLGNRVALEMIADYLSAGAPPALSISGAVLMAAAVQVSMVEDAAGLQKAAAGAHRSMVLYSRQDKVLEWAFPPGEFFAGEGFGVAVGHNGEPPRAWHDRQEMSGYDHGSYWTTGGTASPVRRWLGLSTAADVSSRAVPSWPDADPRSLPQRDIKSRPLGGAGLECLC